jgi:glycerophosphoryl diester phosphodiesterase
VFAHRGLAVDAPENTLLAFARAVAAGAEYIETDVHASSDGVAVVAHDPDLSRVAGVKRAVESLSMNELRRIDLGFDQVFCSLAEALDTFADTRLNIDIKVEAAIAPTIEAIRRANATSRVLVTSFSDKRRLAAVRELPGVATSASARTFATALVAARSGAARVTERALRGVSAVQVPERALGISVTTRRMIDRLHAAGVEVHIWTINDPIRMRELLDLGVDGLVTDRADLALEVVRNYSSP